MHFWERLRRGPGKGLPEVTVTHLRIFTLVGLELRAGFLYTERDFFTGVTKGIQIPHSPLFIKVRDN